MDEVNTIISKTWVEDGEYRIIAKPYKLVKIKKIPSTYPNFFLNVDNSLCHLYDIWSLFQPYYSWLGRNHDNIDIGLGIKFRFEY